MGSLKFEKEDGDFAKIDPEPGVHTLSPAERQDGSGNSRDQHDRGRTAFRGRGARPRTWTEQEAAGISLSPSPGLDESISQALPPPRLVQNLLAAGSAMGDPLVSPGALSRTSTIASGLTGVSAADDGGNTLTLPNIKYGCNGGDSETTAETNNGNRERIGRVSRSKLVEAAAEIAKRGSIATAELVPGLGRGAFEAIPVAPEKAPIRELATAIAKAEAAAAQGSSGGNPRVSGSGNVRVASSSIRKSEGDMFPSETQLGKLTKGSNQRLAAEVNASQTAVSAARRSRSTAVESYLPSKSWSRASQTAAVSHAMAQPSPPALNQPHAPGQVFRPINLEDKGGQKSQRQGGVGVAKIPPFRLASSKRLTSFGSTKDGSPLPPPPPVNTAAAQAERGSKDVGALHTQQTDEAPAARGNDKRVLSTGSSRPLMIDILSSFGSNSAHPTSHSHSRSSSRANQTKNNVRSQSRTQASGPVRMNTLKSHKEEVSTELQTSSGGTDEQVSWRHSSTGLAASHRSQSSGKRAGGGDGSRSGVESCRRSRSGSSNGSSTRRLHSEVSFFLLGCAWLSVQVL